MARILTLVAPNGKMVSMYLVVVHSCTSSGSSERLDFSLGWATVWFVVTEGGPRGDDSIARGSQPAKKMMKAPDKIHEPARGPAKWQACLAHASD